MTAKRQIESSINSGTMLDGTGGHVNGLTKRYVERFSDSRVFCALRPRKGYCDPN